MKGTVLYGPRDIRFEDREDPGIIEPTDAILRLACQRRRGDTSPFGLCPETMYVCSGSGRWKFFTASSFLAR
jgi:hypothetical protein